MSRKEAGAVELTAAGKSYTFSDLALACGEAAALSLRDLPDILPAADPSEIFSARVELLHGQYRSRLRAARIGRSAAGIALALLITFSAVITVNAKAREAFLVWWQEVFPGSTVYRFEGEEPQTVAGAYEIGWLPEGMKAIQRSESEGFGSVVFEGGGHMLVFEYTAGAQAGAFEVFGETEGISVEIDGLPGRLHAEDGRVNLIWSDETAGVVFTISSDLDVQTVLQTAESVRGN